MNLERIQELSDKEEKSIQELGLKLTEEAGEVAQAILSATNASGCEYKRLNFDDVEEEAVDVVLVALSIFFKTGGRMKDLEFLMETKADKWERVTKENREREVIEKINSSPPMGGTGDKIDLTGVETFITTASHVDNWVLDSINKF